MFFSVITKNLKREIFFGLASKQFLHRNSKILSLKVSISAIMLHWKHFHVNTVQKGQRRSYSENTVKSMTGFICVVTGWSRKSF